MTNNGTTNNIHTLGVEVERLRGKLLALDAEFAITNDSQILAVNVLKAKNLELRTQNCELTVANAELKARLSGVAENNYYKMAEVLADCEAGYGELKIENAELRLEVSGLNQMGEEHGKCLIQLEIVEFAEQKLKAENLELKKALNSMISHLKCGYTANQPRIAMMRKLMRLERRLSED